MLMRRRSSAVLIAAAIMVVGFPSVHAQRPTTVDSGGSPGRDSALAVYLRSLRFISDHVSSDQRPLDWRHSRAVARVEPQSKLFSDSATYEGGYVAVRIVNLSDVEVPRFALLSGGITYVWVKDHPDDQYAVYISTDGRGRIVARTRARMLPPFAADSIPLVNAPMARFRVSSDVDTEAQGLCWPRCKTGPWCGPALAESKAR